MHAPWQNTVQQITVAACRWVRGQVGMKLGGQVARPCSVQVGGRHVDVCSCLYVFSGTSPISISDRNQEGKVPCPCCSRFQVLVSTFVSGTVFGVCGYYICEESMFLSDSRLKIGRKYILVKWLDRTSLFGSKPARQKHIHPPLWM